MFKTIGFKYLKNFIIGFGASVVMIGALGKINSYPWGSLAITVGLATEAFLFLMLGIIPPEKDYYWEKLYPGLDRYKSNMSPLTEGDMEGAHRGLNADIVENQLGGMLGELQGMSKSLGSLRALQEVDFSKTRDQIKTMGNFYDKLNDAMRELSETTEDTKKYKKRIGALNENLAMFNTSMAGASALGEMSDNLNASLEDTRIYRESIAKLNNNLSSLNGVYGNILSAMGAKK